MSTLNEKTARAYNDLVEINKSATKGYHEAAEGVSNPKLKSELNRLSQQRAQFASDLTQRARQFGLNPEKDSTIENALTDATAAVHRGWINIKSAVTGHDDSAILRECETGDSSALKFYETAMKAPDLPAAAKTVIEQQHSQIVSARSMVTQWKSQVK